MLLLKCSSGVWRCLALGPEDRGEVKDVAAVDAVLAGDHVGLCIDGVKDEAGLGVMPVSSTSRSSTPSTLVFMNGIEGLCR